MKNTIEALNWRYAVQAFDPKKKLTPEQLTILTEALRLAPSAFGLQPWKFIIVSNPEIRAKLREAAYGQPKVTDASHFIVLATPVKVDAAFADTFIASVAKTRGLKVSDLKGLEDMVKGALARNTPEANREWAARQAYIALGSLLTAAAIEGIDAGPMEGFDPKKFDEILGLDKLGLESRAAVAVGFRDPSDPAAARVKSRFSRDEVIVEVK